MQPTDIFITEDEYLVREPEAEYKSEFRDGRMVAMAGASLAHSRITANLIRRIDSQLDGGPCATYTSHTRIKVAAARFYTYPDVSVVCGTPKVDPPRSSTVTNPTLIAEVLSPGTEAYDRGEKFGYYRKLDSLQEYVLVAQDRVHVERFTREEGGAWIAAVYSSIDDVVELPSIGCRLAVRDIYARVEGVA